MSNGFDQEVLRGNDANGINGFFQSLTALAIGGPPETFDLATAKLLRLSMVQHARSLSDIKAIINPVTARRFGSQWRGDSTMSVLNYLAMSLGGVFISNNVAAGAARTAGTFQMNAAAAVGASTLTVDGIVAGEVLVGDVVAGPGAGNTFTVTSINAGRTSIGITPAVQTALADNNTFTRGASVNNPGLLIKSGPGYADNTALDMWRGVTVRSDEITQVGEGNIRIFLECYHDFVIPRPEGFVEVPFFTLP